MNFPFHLCFLYIGKLHHSPFFYFFWAYAVYSLGILFNVQEVVSYSEVITGLMNSWEISDTLSQNNLSDN